MQNVERKMVENGVALEIGVVDLLYDALSVEVPFLQLFFTILD